ncbi:MAG: DNA-directed RNA polymerase subunit alpha [Dehalococcoidia bacterium]
MSEEIIPQIECAETTDAYGRFVVEPLPRGFGTTLGNGLRRMLLSSLPGAAVTWVRIEGTQHEFSSIPHVKEDVTEFLLNVKALRLRALSQRPGKLILERGGEGEVSAADIEPSIDFEIVNPDLHLATLDSPEARLSVELNVEQGTGYQEARGEDGLPIGVIPVDAVFTPVRKVDFSVEQTHISLEDVSYERLTLEVWTDGTVSAVEAVSRSAEILVERFSLFIDLARVSQKSAEIKALRLSIPPEQYDMPVDKLDLSVRTLNSMRRGGINTLGELLEKSEEELMQLRHFGQKSGDEVKERLQAMGFVPPSEGSPAAVAEGAGELAGSAGDEVEAGPAEGEAPEQPAPAEESEREV